MDMGIGVLLNSTNVSKYKKAFEEVDELYQYIDIFSTQTYFTPQEVIGYDTITNI